MRIYQPWRGSQLLGPNPVKSHHEKIIEYNSYGKNEIRDLEFEL